MTKIKLNLVLVPALFLLILSGCSKAKTAAEVATAASLGSTAQYYVGNWLSSCIHLNNMDMKEYVNFDASANVSYEWYVYGSSGATCTGTPVYKDPQFNALSDGTSPVSAGVISFLDVSSVPNQFVPAMISGGGSTIVQLWYVNSATQFYVDSLNTYSSSLGSAWSDWTANSDVTAFVSAPTNPTLSSNALFLVFNKQ